MIPAGPNSFFVHTATHAKFLGLKHRSGLNKDFEQHGFYIDTQCNVARELSQLCPEISPSCRNWVKRVFDLGLFNGDISDQEAAVASNYAKKVRNGLAVTARQLAQNAITWKWSDDESVFDDWSDINS
jgi:hypothetical protein